jgi:hypothetical protein
MGFSHINFLIQDDEKRTVVMRLQPNTTCVSIVELVEANCNGPALKQHLQFGLTCINKYGVA